jgi:hypothetical protein
MSPSFLRRGRAVAFLLLIVPAAACSLLLNTKADQCGSDADCKKLSATAVCQVNVCVDNGASTEAGTVEAGSTDGSVLPDGAPLGDAGCTPKVPDAQTDYLNETCTNAVCIPFDNCARLGVCDGSLPALIVPDGGF